jgi:hypothetical protein
LLVLADSLPFHPTPNSATGPAIGAISSALGPRRKIEIQVLTRYSPIPSNGEMCSAVIDKSRPIESIGSRLRGSGVRARFNSRRIHFLDLCTASFPVSSNVAYGFLTGLNIKTNASKCSIAGIFLTKDIMQHFPRYIHCHTTADSAGGSSRCC